MESSSTIEFTRIYLAFFYSFVAAFYLVRILARNRVKMPEAVFNGPCLSSNWLNHVVFRLFRLVIWLVCFVRVFFPSIDNYLGLFVGLNTWPVLVTGNILLTLGFILTLIVHFNLGNQWRSGVDPKGPQQLKTDGFYKYSRNPMFVCVALAQSGFFLALPSIFSVVCLVIGWGTLSSQIKVEEIHLSKKFANEYNRYRTQVRRWL